MDICPHIYVHGPAIIWTGVSHRIFWDYPYSLGCEFIYIWSPNLIQKIHKPAKKFQSKSNFWNETPKVTHTHTHTHTLSLSLSLSLFLSLFHFRISLPHTCFSRFVFMGVTNQVFIPVYQTFFSFLFFYVKKQTLRAVHLYYLNFTWTI